MNPKDEMILLGDFNLPNILWEYNADDDDYLPREHLSPRDFRFLDAISSCGLHQMSDVRNDLGRHLDLVFSTDTDNLTVDRSLNALSKLDKHHPPLLITFCVESLNNSLNEVDFAFNFKKAVFEDLSVRLEAIDFSDILGSEDIDLNVERLYSKIYDIFTSCVPFERSHSHAGSPPWFNKDLRTLRNERNKLWKVYLRNRDPVNYNRFLCSYNEFHVKSLQLYDEYVMNMRDRFSYDPRSFYKFVNLKKKNDNYPQSMTYQGYSTLVSSEISNLFASFFENAITSCPFVPDVNNFTHLRCITNADKIFPMISDETISQHIDLLPNDFSVGPDGIPPIFIKSCSRALIAPLGIIFRKSLCSGQFPLLWKSSFFIPIHKSGNKSDISNYRPIAKLSCIPKLFESIIYSQISKECKSLISINQHGFISGRSTTTNLVEFTSCVIRGFEKNFQTDCIYTDFSKAFDKLSHSVILFKLKRIGFSPIMLKWFESYLTGRTYQVTFRGSSSKHINATSGVPQGSHLGPLLFILSIDDITHLLKRSSVLIYADDMKIFSPIKQLRDCHDLQNDLNIFFSWCKHNNLELNVGKCEVLSFHRNLHPITFDYSFSNCSVKRVISTTDLGVKLTPKLDFISHVNYITCRANSTLGFIKRWSNEFSSIAVSTNLYYSFVRPILEYASQVWNPYYFTHINRIESVQKNFLRFVLRNLPWENPIILPPYSDRLKLLNMCSLEERRKIADVLFIHKLLNSNIDSVKLLDAVYIRSNTHNLRNFHILQVNSSTRNYGAYEPINRMCRSVNDCLESFELDLSTNVLRHRLHSLH